MKKYNIGDHVKIRSDLIPGRVYGGESFVDPMEEYAGKDAIIVRELTANEYFLDVDKDDHWGWTPEMFE